MGSEKPQNSNTKGPKPSDGRLETRFEVATHGINATLAIILGNRTMGFVVPVKDFSKTGIGLFSRMKVDPGTPVRLSVEGTDCAPIDGRVVWCGSSAFDQGMTPENPYRVGVEYQASDDAARDAQIAIFRFLSKFVGASTS